MTQDTNTDAAVEQCDRDAAADYLDKRGDDYWTTPRMREGQCDDHPLVLLLARHRLATRQPSPTAAEVREGCAKVVMGWPESLLCIFGHDQSEQLAAAIRAVPLPTGDAPAATSDAEAVIAYAREASCALTDISGGGSEMFKRIGDEFYADPALCRQRAQEKFATRERLATLPTEPPASTALRKLLKRARNVLHDALMPDGIYPDHALPIIADIDAALASPTTDKGEGK